MVLKTFLFIYSWFIDICMAIPSQIFEKAYNLLPIETEEGEYLYNNAPLAELIFLADRIRQIHRPGNNVGWIIDRNVNITNVCFSQCSFCNFWRKKGSPDAYITSFEEYSRKIRELYSLGGDQLLLQGGMNPDLDLGFYSAIPQVRIAQIFNGLGYDGSQWARIDSIKLPGWLLEFGGIRWVARIGFFGRSLGWD